MNGEFNSLVMKDWLALNPKVYSHNHQSIQEKHDNMMKYKKAEVHVDKGKPQVYKVINNNGDDDEGHQLIFKNKKTLKGVSKAVVKNE